MINNGDVNESFVSHIVELRNRVIKAFSAILICFLSMVYWAPDIYNFFATPLMAVLPKGVNMIATDVAAPFFVPIKVTMLLSFVVALPFVLWQAWSFVSPGLYEDEKKLAIPVLLSSFFLFLWGMAFAYWIVFPAVFGFVSSYTPEGVEMATDIDKYFSFCLSLFFIFGLSFETPVVQMLLIRTGIVSIDQMAEFRPYFIVLAFIIAAIVTPPDVISQLMLAIPLCFLFEFGIWLSRFTLNRSEKNQKV
ncbi:MAG: twin-arginine translocase subunit TatC [Betaproteobacteria bacterium TMED82]|nr:MAG: twin-arginine translocase subunit TatC [Betaproteobacteria bacterium TMED82]|tara:strand:- start:1450 stop:2196 length:747 start_codon:yes stop_codon:yes gene_type:complete